MAELARHFTKSVLAWIDIHALIANSLVALYKCPGVSPIGIGEVPRRILGKAILLATCAYMKVLCRSDQLCSGVKMGIKGAI